MAAAPPPGARPPRRDLLSYAEFVDAALFDPTFGYYSRGGVRFGEGGHYDTYPLALSPMFGRMVAQYAFGLWRRLGEPAQFEICELGAGNGQLCLDTLLWLHERGRHDPRWRRFADRTRYRIIERSPALIARQRAQLGTLAEMVRWSRADLSRRPIGATPFRGDGLLVANEVLDCLPHHKVLPRPGAAPAVVFVAAALRGRRLDRRGLAAVLRRRQRPRLSWREVPVAATTVPGLAPYLRRHYPELAAPSRRQPPYFACPRLEPLMRNTARCYRRSEALWIDYGAGRAFHLAAPEARKVFAGPPKSRRGVFDDPGNDDITFMVDFSAAAAAARGAGWEVVFSGPQAELARRAGVRLDRAAVDTIVHHRALTWMLALIGSHPEHAWRRGAVTWAHGPSRGRVPVRRYVERAVREFGAPRSPFQLFITRRG